MADNAVDYDSELQRYQELLPTAWHIQPGERVLDIGCGRGETTRVAARATGTGRVLGIDISPNMIEGARDITRSEGPGNAEFVCGDAASYEFEQGEYDLIVSRFGTMFFADPPAAFSNMAQALRNGGRLSMLVWRDAGLNEWTIAIRDALGSAGHRPAESSSAKAFSLGDRDFTANVLTMAGLREIAFREMSAPVYYGRDGSAALEWICGFANVKQVLAEMSAADRSRAVAALIEVIAQHDCGQGVWFSSCAWLVSARKP